MSSDSVTISTAVTSCSSCTKQHNSAWDHDDPFTAVPCGSWSCVAGGFSIEDNVGFNRRTDIHKSCPFRKTQP